MADYWHAYECFNCEVCLDVRADASMTLVVKCPVCKKPLDCRGAIFPAVKARGGYGSNAHYERLLVDYSVLLELSESKVPEVTEAGIFPVFYAFWQLFRGNPVPMELYCPKCHLQHVDEGEWAYRRHKTHLCVGCGNEWRPALIPTVGVANVEAP